MSTQRRRKRAQRAASHTAASSSGRRAASPLWTRTALAIAAALIVANLFVYLPAVGFEFVSYDDPESLRMKARYVVANGLAGLMFLEYGADPSRALLGTLNDELRRR